MPVPSGYGGTPAPPETPPGPQALNKLDVALSNLRYVRPTDFGVSSWADLFPAGFNIADEGVRSVLSAIYGIDQNIAQNVQQRATGYAQRMNLSPNPNWSASFIESLAASERDAILGSRRDGILGAITSYNTSRGWAGPDRGAPPPVTPETTPTPSQPAYPGNLNPQAPVTPAQPESGTSTLLGPTPEPPGPRFRVNETGDLVVSTFDQGSGRYGNERPVTPNEFAQLVSSMPTHGYIDNTVGSPTFGQMVGGNSWMKRFGVVGPDAFTPVTGTFNGQTTQFYKLNPFYGKQVNATPAPGFTSTPNPKVPYIQPVTEVGGRMVPGTGPAYQSPSNRSYIPPPRSQVVTEAATNPMENWVNQLTFLNPMQRAAWWQSTASNPGVRNQVRHYLNTMGGQRTRGLAKLSTQYAHWFPQLSGPGGGSPSTRKTGPTY